MQIGWIFDVAVKWAKREPEHVMPCTFNCFDFPSDEGMAYGWVGIAQIS
jgi:hypothetical protein